LGDRPKPELFTAMSDIAPQRDRDRANKKSSKIIKNNHQYGRNP
jgi:hypothetical protein